MDPKTILLQTVLPTVLGALAGVALGLAGPLRKHAALLTGLGCTVGYAISHVIVAGAPTLPPHLPEQSILLAGLAAFALRASADFGIGRGALVGGGLAAVALAGVSGVVAWPLVANGGVSKAVALQTALVTAALLGLGAWRLETAVREGAGGAAAGVLALMGGLGGVAVILGGSALVGQLAAGIGAGFGAAAVAALVRPASAPGFAGCFAAIALLGGLLADAYHYVEVPLPVLIACAAPIFATEAAVRLRRRGYGERAAAVAAGLLALPPLAYALHAAYALAEARQGDW